jgi:NAD(P)-dependent dehydrogenase (short-subunit alcohol dehydrogenase family)
MNQPKIMVVTGASTGVGKAVCLYFSKKGWVICALARSADKLAQLAAEGGEKIYSYPTDVTKSEQVEKTFEQIIQTHQRIDVLVNNAGVTTGKKPVDNNLIDQIIDTNLKGTLYCTFAALPVMQEQKSGRIVNISSIAGVDIAPAGGNGLYAAAKHGVVAFSESLGKMVRKEGILVTALCPGGIDTPLWDEENPYPFPRESMIRPGEVADLIGYILSQPERTLFKNVIFVPVVEQW